MHSLRRAALLALGVGLEIATALHTIETKDAMDDAAEVTARRRMRAIKTTPEATPLSSTEVSGPPASRRSVEVGKPTATESKIQKVKRVATAEVGPTTVPAWMITSTSEVPVWAITSTVTNTSTTTTTRTFSTSTVTTSTTNTTTTTTSTTTTHENCKCLPWKEVYAGWNLSRGEQHSEEFHKEFNFAPPLDCRHEGKRECQNLKMRLDETACIKDWSIWRGQGSYCVVNGTCEALKGGYEMTLSYSIRRCVNYDDPLWSQVRTPQEAYRIARRDGLSLGQLLWRTTDVEKTYDWATMKVFFSNLPESQNAFPKDKIDWMRNFAASGEMRLFFDHTFPNSNQYPWGVARGNQGWEVHENTWVHDQAERFGVDKDSFPNLHTGWTCAYGCTAEDSDLI